MAFVLPVGRRDGGGIGRGRCLRPQRRPPGHPTLHRFQVVPEPKTIKNRVYLDVHATEAGTPWHTRRQQLLMRADSLTALGGLLREPMPSSPDEHLACKINDPDGNELCLV